ncbi:MAG: hypothetical protein KZQ79_10050, partial [Candidatus Thiodiazotropha sp. (ex Lucinoma borealis)]|nr:hypothetical protein [Candidatus Thiodiazotropha sp. (ex Lucinoma borealis)]
MGQIDTIANLPLLSTLLLLPLIGIAAIWLIPVAKARHVTLITLTIALIPAIAVIFLLDKGNPDFQFVEQ